MEISLTGIEQAIEGLGYRRDTSPKSRLVYTLRNRYLDGKAVESVVAMDADALIDAMWNLGGDEKAIRSKRKNLSSIKSSVNADLDEAWELGRNPEGITVGPLNTFVMSDAAKDKILSSFSGAVNLEGGNSLNRVAEALKIVSDYLSKMPGGLENDKLSNLKSLVEGLAEKFREGGGPGEFEIIPKKTDDENATVIKAKDDADMEIDASKVVVGEEPEAFELDDTKSIEFLEEEDAVDEADEIETVDENDLVEDEIADEEEWVDEEERVEDDEDEEPVEVETVADNDVVEDEIADEVEWVDEDELVGDEEEAPVEGETETVEIDDADLDDLVPDMNGSDAVELEVPDEVETVDENDLVEDEIADEEEWVDEEERVEDDKDEEPVEVETETVEIDDADLDDLVPDMNGSDALELDVPDEVEVADENDVGGDEISDPEALDAGDGEIVEIIDEDDAIDEPDEVEPVKEDEVLEDVVESDEGLEDDAELEEIDETELDDMDEALEANAAEYEDDDVVEVMGEESASELDELDILEDEDILEEIEEADEADAENVDESGGETVKNDVGLPLDQLAENALDFEEFKPDEEQKRLLAERFDGYLGAMERYYNQYIIIKKGKYGIGANDAQADALDERMVLLPDFYMGKYPVTNALFEVFIERTGYKTTAEKAGFGYVFQGRFQKAVDPETGVTRSVWNPAYTKKKVDGAAWYRPTGPGSTLHQKRNHPVVQVSIKDARTFAAWTGKRLPTEIEWEAAARTRSGFIFPWGNEWRKGCCNLENSGLSDTCPVDAHPLGVNEAGLADLLGNVFEWTADECEPKYALEKPVRFFVAKGGSWVDNEKTALYHRMRFQAEFTANIIGFRCLAD